MKLKFATGLAYFTRNSFLHNLIKFYKSCVANHVHDGFNGDQSMSFARGSGIFSIACCNRSSRASLDPLNATSILLAIESRNHILTKMK